MHFLLSFKNISTPLSHLYFYSFSPKVCSYVCYCRYIESLPSASLEAVCVVKLFFLKVNLQNLHSWQMRCVIHKKTLLLKVIESCDIRGLSNCQEYKASNLTKLETKYTIQYCCSEQLTCKTHSHCRLILLKQIYFGLFETCEIVTLLVKGAYFICVCEVNLIGHTCK